MQNKKLKINEERFRIALKQTSNTIFEYDIKTKSLLNTSKELDKYNIYKITKNVPYSLVESGVIHKDFSDDFINMYENVINGAKSKLCS